MAHLGEAPLAANGGGRSVVHVAWAALGLCAALAGAARADFRIPEAGVVPLIDPLTGLETSIQDVPSLASSLPAIGVPAMRSSYPFITGTGQTIAVIDTGVDYTHPALAGRYVGGYDFAEGDDDPMDTHGHGTHVAGIAVSADSTYTGVAPGANLVALKVFADGSSVAYDEHIVAARNWVVANADAYHITAVNISLGDTSEWKNSDVNPLYLREFAFEALKDKGIFIACASGNDGYLNGVSYPAASRYTVSVGGTWANDDFSQYLIAWDDRYQWNAGDGPEDARLSDYGPRQDNIMALTNRYSSAADGQLDLFAPGAVITSAVPFEMDDDGNQDGWPERRGTSRAAPHAAAAAVLVRQALELNDMLDPDGAGALPPLTQHARYAGYTTVAGMNIIIQFIVLDPGQIMAMGGIKAQMGPELGHPSLVVLDNPVSQEEAPGAISDFCTPLNTTTVLLG